jgi:hypothetical protein
MGLRGGSDESESAFRALRGERPESSGLAGVAREAVPALTLVAAVSFESDGDELAVAVPVAAAVVEEAEADAAAAAEAKRTAASSDTGFVSAMAGSGKNSFDGGAASR